MIDLSKEYEFYSKPFKFSYSSINKLLFSPKLFYKDYILLDREERTDKHLIEGKLLHCLLFEPDNVSNKFKVVPGKLPSDSLRKVLHRLNEISTEKHLLSTDQAWQEKILKVLEDVNLYQSLKSDDAKLKKVQTDDNNVYWSFISNPIVDAIDEVTLQRAKERLEYLKENDHVNFLNSTKPTEFELDELEIGIEKYLECDLEGYDFGLKGFIDHFVIDNENKKVIITDLKTTGKSIADFADAVDYYNYNLQATIYFALVYHNYKDQIENYDFEFKFTVIDTYNQVYTFSISEDTWNKWNEKFYETLQVVDYHYKNRVYNLPFQFIGNEIKL